MFLFGNGKMYTHVKNTINESKRKNCQFIIYFYSNNILVL